MNQTHKEMLIVNLSFLSSFFLSFFDYFYEQSWSGYEDILMKIMNVTVRKLKLLPAPKYFVSFCNVLYIWPCQGHILIIIQINIIKTIIAMIIL